MTKACRKCEGIVRDGDLIKALVTARFKEIPSRVHYGMTKPESCLWLEHVFCEDPQGMFGSEEGE